MDGYLKIKFPKKEPYLKTLACFRKLLFIPLVSLFIWYGLAIKDKSII